MTDAECKANFYHVAIVTEQAALEPLKLLNATKSFEGRNV
jgi:hypothetical protein